MQSRIADGYTELAGLIFSDVAPVGIAWREALAGRPDLELWKRDGHHPTGAGSYLAACVFYRELTGRDPLNSGYIAGLEESEARFLQTTADEVVAQFEEAG